MNVHSAICEMSLVWWHSIHLWSIGGDTSVISICAFIYILNVFSVVVFHTSMVNWRRGALVYRHSAICEILWCSSFPCISGQLEGSTFTLSIYAFCYMLN